MQVEQPPRAQYEQLADDLRAKIADGTYPIGARLPSMKELMTGNGVSQTVVRDALRLLKTDGLVQGQPGKGVYVIDVPRPGEKQPTYREVVNELRGMREVLGDLTRRVADVEERLGEPPSSGWPS